MKMGNSVDTTAIRWDAHTSPKQLRSTSLFSRLASRVRTIHSNCNLESSYQIDRSEPLYEHVPATNKTSVRHWVSSDELAICLEQSRPVVSSTQHKQANARVSRDSVALKNTQELRSPTVLQQNTTPDCQPSPSDPQPKISWTAMDAGSLAAGSGDDDCFLTLSQSLESRFHGHG
jgi:hypothetical protein